MFMVKKRYAISFVVTIFFGALGTLQANSASDVIATQNSKSEKQELVQLAKTLNPNQVALLLGSKKGNAQQLEDLLVTQPLSQSFYKRMKTAIWLGASAATIITLALIYMAYEKSPDATNQPANTGAQLDPIIDPDEAAALELSMHPNVDPQAAEQVHNDLPTGQVNVVVPQDPVIIPEAVDPDEAAAILLSTQPTVDPAPVEQVHNEAHLVVNAQPANEGEAARQLAPGVEEPSAAAPKTNKRRIAQQQGVSGRHFKELGTSGKKVGHFEETDKAPLTMQAAAASLPRQETEEQLRARAARLALFEKKRSEPVAASTEKLEEDFARLSVSDPKERSVAAKAPKKKVEAAENSDKQRKESMQSAARKRSGAKKLVWIEKKPAPKTEEVVAAAAPVVKSVEKPEVKIVRVGGCAGGGPRWKKTLGELGVTKKLRELLS